MPVQPQAPWGRFGGAGWQPLSTPCLQLPLPHPLCPHPGRGPHWQSHMQEGTALLASSRAQESQAGRPGPGLGCSWHIPSGRRPHHDGTAGSGSWRWWATLSCMSRKTIAFLALSLIMATQSVRVRQQRVQGLAPLTWHKGRVPEKVVRGAGSPATLSTQPPPGGPHGWPRAARLRLCSPEVSPGACPPTLRTAGGLCTKHS